MSDENELRYWITEALRYELTRHCGIAVPDGDDWQLVIQRGDPVAAEHERHRVMMLRMGRSTGKI